MLFSVLVQLLVHLLEVLVGLGKLLVLAFESKAGGTVFDAVLHFGDYHFQVLDLAFEEVEVVRPAICACVLSLQLKFRLFLVFEKRFNGSLKFSIFLRQSMDFSFIILFILRCFLLLSKYNLHFFPQSLNLFSLTLSNLFRLPPSKLIILQFHSKKVNLPFFLLNDLCSLRLEVLYFLSDDVLIVECLMRELLCFVGDP